jgi:hypothetical protein
MGPWAAEVIAPHLPTTAGLEALYARMHPAGQTHDIKRVVSLNEANYFTNVDVSSGTTVISSANRPAGANAIRLWTANPTSEPFRRVGHCLWALLVACVGGVVGRALHARGERATV